MGTLLGLTPKKRKMEFVNEILLTSLGNKRAMGALDSRNLRGVVSCVFDISSYLQVHTFEPLRLSDANKNASNVFAISKSKNHLFQLNA